MTWELSRFRAGDVVEVRSKAEILATLDEQGCIDGLPFMPEMFKFCGQRVQVRAVAHKTCDVAQQTLKVRRLHSTVHLGNLRCDGSAHGGCQADCTLFWNDAWLKPAEASSPPDRGAAGTSPTAPRCTEVMLQTQTLAHAEAAAAEPIYACQATKLFDATTPLSKWEEYVQQHVYDVKSGNHTVGRVVRVIWLSGLRKLTHAVEGIRFVYGVCWRVRDWMHQRLTGRETPSLFKTVKPLEKTPTGRLGLKPGERVRIKPKLEIEKTLGKFGKNRGLTFDPQEMAPYCGGTYQVRSSVNQIVDEATGKMRVMKEPCIILEGVVCNADYASCRLNCPRAIFSYWREIWLERVDTPTT
jgi:hypothetical protein